MKTYIFSRSTILMVCITLCLSIVCACGPIRSTMAAKDTETTLAEADQYNAATKIASAYYYWAAQEYLVKARRTLGYSDFDDSQEFCVKAQELADIALEKAKKGKKPVIEPELSEKLPKAPSNKNKEE